MWSSLFLFRSCSDFGDGRDSDDDRSKKAGGKIHSAKVSAMKAELRSMIAQPLVARGISVKYLTSGSRSIVDDLISAHGK